LGRAILRLIEPTGGKISYEGQDITTLSRAGMKLFRRRMQVVFQDPISSLNPRLTVAGTLTEPLAVHGIGESREERLEIARRTLQRVQLDPDYLWRYPHEFSGGQRQRICIARALALDPSFIICDEVTSALDMSVQAEILKMLLDLRRERNLTILFITHDIGVVEYISDEIAVMYSGQIVERGTTGQVCGAPKHPYTQKLLAAVPRVRL
jgi:peptide/nickel transport system ATP-binding protein